MALELPQLKRQEHLGLWTLIQSHMTTAIKQHLLLQMEMELYQLPKQEHLDLWTHTQLHFRMEQQQLLRSQMAEVFHPLKNCNSGIG